MAYRRKFREQNGELTPRNLDHPVSGGLVDVEGRRALIYGNPWRGFSSPPVPVLHPMEGKETASSERWPVEPVDGGPRFRTTVNSAQNCSFPHEKADLITAGNTDMAVITQQFCFYKKKVCDRKKVITR